MILDLIHKLWYFVDTFLKKVKKINKWKNINMCWLFANDFLWAKWFMYACLWENIQQIYSCRALVSLAQMYPNNVTDKKSKLNIQILLRNRARICKIAQRNLLGIDFFSRWMWWKDNSAKSTKSFFLCTHLLKFSFFSPCYLICSIAWIQNFPTCILCSELGYDKIRVSNQLSIFTGSQRSSFICTNSINKIEWNLHPRWKAL